jgi:hypothetical protein
LKRTLNLLSTIAKGDETYQQAHARRLADAFSYTAQAALLLTEAQWELDHDLTTIKLEATTHFINRHLRRDYDPLEDESFLPRIEKLMMAY